MVHGEPGVGKSALLDYLARRAAGCRVVRAAGVEPSRGAFFRLALVATPLALVLATLSLWLTLQVTG